jgi:AraC-like DNA-binding protein
MKNVFDTVMDYIDENIHETTEAIKIGIHRATGYNSKDFGGYFQMLIPDMSFYRYIITRKLYFAGKELYEKPDKSICEIALDYGYSEQSALNRAMKNYFDCTPNELRKGLKIIPDDKMKFSGFCEKNERTDNRLKNIIERFNEVGMLTGKSEEYLEAFERASNEYGFDADTCYAISEVAERLEIPVETLIESCFDLMADIHSSPDYLSPEVEAAIDCGISSEAELKEICSYFDCKYYDLDSFMVEAYRTQKQN